MCHTTSSATTATSASFTCRVPLSHWSYSVASAIPNAETFRFDLSDLQPAAFGGTPGQGLFKAFSDFVANPNNVDQITKQMEAAAKKAYANE